ncbi:hypothetical protein GCM10008024_40390 [Allgaiera indica]|uniref:Uncharacterized protein n=1 Tax=Allgaiera indica TaxID=765699 RepID=A0AAN4UVP3_9RHOB|nr:hypothetical protein [Allgaiera indica]GHE06345.1 hypothetical protein GCM10008024_40390 [Allgaiera indica]SDX91712.1 hypothetical protein SAMN05444006_14311 [Allgaiera indica]
MVIDGPGGGKSTLVTRGLKRHEVLARGPDGQPLYLSADVPSPATFKSMGLELLRLSGYLSPAELENRNARAMVKNAA